MIATFLKFEKLIFFFSELRRYETYTFNRTFDCLNDVDTTGSRGVVEKVRRGRDLDHK